MAIKPVEIEFLMKDGITPSLNKASDATSKLADNAEEMAQEMGAAIKAQAAEIKKLEGELSKLNKQMSKAKPAAYEEMSRELERAKRVTAEAKHEHEELQKKHQQSSNTARSLKSELRELTATLASMRLAGQQNSEEYARLAARSAELVDTMGDVRAEANALAHDNAGLQGVISGVSGLAGGFTALTGAMSLFAGENEELMKIQTKLQSVMAITMGLQQMMDTLNRDSAFSAVTLKKAKELLTAANGRLAVSLGISTIAAKALMATLTLGASLLVTAVVVAWNKYNDAQEEARRKAQELLEVEKNGRAEQLRNKVELEGLMRSLKAFVGTREEEKKKVTELNSKYGEAFGYYKTVAEWYDALKQKSAAYIQMMFLEAKARALVDKAVKTDEDIAKTEAELKTTKPGLWDYYVASSNQAHGNSISAEEIATADLKRTLAEQKKVKEDALKEAQQLNEQAAELAKGFSLGGHEDPEKEQKEQERLRREAEARAKERMELLKTLGEEEEKTKQGITDKRLKANKEGYERERAEAQIAHEAELRRIKAEEKARLKLIKELRSKGVKLSAGKEAETSALARSEEALVANSYASQLKEINDREAKERADRLAELLSQHQSYDARRRKIEEDYTRYVRDLESLRTEGNSHLINDALRVAKQNRAESLRLVDKDEIEASQQTSTLLVSLFEDAADKSTSAIRRIIAESESLLSYLKTTSADKIESRSGISAKQLRYMQGSPEEMKELADGIEKMKKTLADRSPITGFFSELSKGINLIKKGGKENLGQGISMIGSATTAVMPHIKAFGQSLATVFGDSELSDNIGILTDSIAGIGSIATGVGQMLSGDILGGIQGAISGITSIVSMASKAEEAHRNALRKVHEAQLSFEREYNLLLLRQNLLLKEASTPFGEERVRKAANALKVYAEATEAYKKSLKGEAIEMPKSSLGQLVLGDYVRKQNEAVKKGYGALQTVRIVTGHEKTGLFGWGKGRDTYTALLELYPEIIDKQGQLNTEMLKTVIAERSMSDEHKRMLENLIKQQDVMKEAESQFDEYLSSTFGSLGSSISSALTTSIREGDDALQLFANDAAKTIENLGEQMIYSLFFADKFAQLQNQLRTVYKSGKSSREVAEEGRRVISEFYHGIGDEVNEAKAWAEEWRRSAAKEGFSIWSNSTASQSAKAGAFQTMTQDQGTKLEGLFTSAQVHWASIDDKVISITSSLSGVLDSLSRIDLNTRPISAIYEELQTLKRDGIKLK